MKKEFKIILVIVLLVISVVAGYLIGYKRAYDKMEKSSQAISQEVFYAKVKEANDQELLVEGLSVNDINFRGEFYLSIIEETELLWRGTKIKIDDLNIGDNIAITFDGEILESYPAQIKNVIKIQLLDDEK